MIRLGFHAVVSLLARLAIRWPRLAMRAADLFGTFLPHAMHADAIHALLPGADAKHIARKAQRVRMRNVVLMASVTRFGIAPIRALVLPSETLATLGGPVIIATFHIGPFPALLSAVEQLPGSVMVIRRNELAHVRAANVTVAGAGGNEQQRVLSFHRALNQLRGGGFVVMALDPEEANRIDVPFRGRTLRLARGAFALARLARVPIVPIVTRWRGADIEIVSGEAIPPGDDEQVLAEAAADWLERYLLATPDELSARIVELSG